MGLHEKLADFVARARIEREMRNGNVLSERPEMIVDMLVDRLYRHELKASDVPASLGKKHRRYLEYRILRWTGKVVKL